MSALVVDASVAAKWFLDEEHCMLAREVLEPGRRLHVPDYFLLEMDSVFCKRTRSCDMTPGEALDARALLRQLPLALHPFAALQDSAFEIANRTRQTSYDCLYVALAIQLGARVVTADRRLCNGLAVTPYTEFVLWVEDVEEEAEESREPRP